MPRPYLGAAGVSPGLTGRGGEGNRSSMLMPPEVRPFLNDDDYNVRDLARDYLCVVHDPAVATQDDLWAVMDRYRDPPNGIDERLWIARRLADFPPGERSLDRLVAALRAERDGVVRDALARSAAELPPAALRRVLGDEAATARLFVEDVAELTEDLELSELSPGALVEELEACVAGVARIGVTSRWGDEHRWSPHVQRARRVVRALARHPEQARAFGLPLLRGPRPTDLTGAWREIFALQIFGRVPVPEVEERLFEIIADETFKDSEDDADKNAATNALARIGTLSVVRAVEERAAGAGPRFYFYAPSILAAVKHPETEAAVLRMLDREADRERRTEWAETLCKLCTTSLDPITKMVMTGEYDQTVSDLDLRLLALCAMTGQAPPDSEAWRLRPDPLLIL